MGSNLQNQRYGPKSHCPFSFCCQHECGCFIFVEQNEFNIFIYITTVLYIRALCIRTSGSHQVMPEIKESDVKAIEDDDFTITKTRAHM